MNLVPLAIQGGMALGGSLLGNKLSKAKSTPLEQGVLNNAQNIQGQTATAGTNLLNQGQQGAQAPMNYWSSILSGNRGGITSALGPELMRLGEGYNAASKTSASLNPRGGPSSTFLAEQPWQQQRDTTTLLQGARPQAATSLFDAANRTIGQGANLLQSSTAAGRSILDQQQNLRQLEAQRGGAIGQGLFSLIQKYGPQLDEYFKNKSVPKLSF
jgi:hypothetical protein